MKENIMNLEIYKFAEDLGSALMGKELTVVTAESCTGGLLASCITDVPGSSSYFERGFVTYSNISKREDLGVKSETLEAFGAVSEQVAQEMSKGALKNSNADVAVAVTGIAGPGLDSKNKQVGTVCFAISFLELPTKAVTMRFDGNRCEVKLQAVKFALEILLENI